ncbi:hypothetical protein ASPWEDRAFT_100908 [Aspergillus wentii DTO 134E9]|uniref:Uncharacterized protein n=1 Tax=Aspergillus wentii DTO 134E9 TaxID=1073089 RepID=A0A1L9S0D5_ASPWE|nr:uncharacterized protein ASPWEDRAFT_100908 [Aspergillus wentii DTO 134E9]OJJ40603.1 hypothetical protein ASPWEDRAFT_100908 [Aspergillus wentii DTO 134E9]
MASRQYNVPYNPRDWGPVSGASPSSGQNAYHHPQSNNMVRMISRPPQHGSHSEVSLSPPPPPYSSPSQQQQRDSTTPGSSRIGSTSPSAVPSYHQGRRHVSVEPAVEYRQQPIPRTRPLSMVDAGHNRQMSLPPPPPPRPQGMPSSRSSSHNRTDGYSEQSSSGVRPRPEIMVSQDGRQPLSNSQNHLVADDFTRAPGSRRAVSAGPIVSNPGSSSRATSQTRNWEPGMPLPPPPPGPPPSTTRSHSVNGSPESSVRNAQVSARTRTRPPPVLGTGLDSIPPTPAGWVDESSTETESRQRKNKAPLTIDTTEVALSLRGLDSGESLRSAGGGNLFRSPAVRDPSAKGIRERRIERRNRQGQGGEELSAVSTSNPWAEAMDQVRPSNLVLADSNDNPDNSRHQTSTRHTPRSNNSFGSDGQQHTSRSRASSNGLFSSRSSFSTPKAEPSPMAQARGFAQTPPFSPDGKQPSPALAKEVSQVLPPKALPTPPLNSAQDGRPSSRLARGEDRPVSHILHLPNEALSTVSPLSPHRDPTKQRSSLDSVVNQDSSFVQDAIQRHKSFVEKEARAVTEAEALRLFADFVVTESQIRRERYAGAWDSGSFDVEDVRRSLFEAPSKPMPEPEAIQSTPPSLGRKISGGAPMLRIPQSRPESAWWSNYKPSLSPIASLSMSNDEMSSRGRAPSRWWESRTGSSSDGGERKVHRSKRESKYMGLPREAMQLGQGQASFTAEEASHGMKSTGQYAAYGPDEYPPEKVGWHEEPALPPPPTTTGYCNLGWSREPPKMDISRLITLPPPYPRHYPAVNNSHPDLVSYRTLVRSISDLSEIKATRQDHKLQVDSLSQGHQERVKEGRQQFKANIQNQIHEGSITFAEAAEAEAALIVEENKLERGLAKQELDTYQESVMKPIHAILTDRISRATACIDELSSRLFDDARHETPDQTQEEGDEKPELLEKLTQLKWLFEAREQLHREMYDLVSDRDEKYKAVVMLPYKQKPNEDKVRETNAFFFQDALDRRVQYETNALARLESFMDVIEKNVVRGVEIQLSAFWDIAPGLLTLIQEIPKGLGGSGIQIPANEYEENPSYHRHPLQYLYTLLSHAEKSSYQYIESQTNLLCLLHEVKSAVMRANCKLMEAERIRQGEAKDAVSREMQESRADEERALTIDLKDKVATVECQWTEALGGQILDLREAIKEQLISEDGWEDLEQLEQA